MVTRSSHEVFEPSGRVRVLLIDDHAILRQGLRSVLESYTDVEVIGGHSILRGVDIFKWLRAAGD